MKKTVGISVNIGPDWRLTSDKFCYSLEVRRVAEQSGVERWENQGYYATLQIALTSLLERDIRQQFTEDITELSQRLNDLKEWVAEAITEAVKQQGGEA